MLSKKNILLFAVLLFAGLQLSVSASTPDIDQEDLDIYGEGGSDSPLATGRSQVAVDVLPRIANIKTVCAPDQDAQQTAPTYCVNPWSWVNGIARNGVAQVFTYHGTFDWIEPYKTPKQGLGAGSAFFIDTNGTLVTNYHVVEGQRGVYIQLPFFGKRRFDVKVIGACPERDLALIRVIPEDMAIIKRELGELPVLKLGDSDQVKRAEEVMTLGYPLGQEWLKSTIGVVSGQQHINGRYMIQIDAAINPGNSGGPSFDSSGNVIGVNTAGITEGGAQNVGYIIPANEVKLFLQQLDGAAVSRDVKFLRKPFVGALFNESSEYMARYLGNPVDGGLYVVSTFKNSPIDRAGIKAGDIICEVDGHPIDYFGDIQVPWSEDRVSINDYSSRLKLGDSLHVVYYRAGKRCEAKITFTLVEFPPIRSRYPDFEYIDYEVFGGMVFMDLAFNHIPILISKNPALDNFMEFENQLEPAVVMTHILPDSEASKTRTLYPGSVIKEINGIKVKTLEELRRAVLESKKTGYLTLKIDNDLFTVISFTNALRDEGRLSSYYFYRITPFVNRLILDSGTK